MPKLFYVLVVGTIVIDQVTKFLAAAWGTVGLNGGISFGLLAPLPSWFLTISLMVLFGLVWWQTRDEWAAHPWAAGLFAGGAISNLIDRLLLGGVRDWLPIPWLAMHNNVADYAIVIGLGLLVFGYWHDRWLKQHLNEELTLQQEADDRA